MSPDDSRRAPLGLLPVGWYETTVTSGGYGVYLKKVRSDELSAGSAGFKFAGGSLTTYRVVYNPFCGGWIADINRKDHAIRHAAFPTPLSAIVALEVALANGL